MKKLLVLFPGVGYSTARPLLYYAKQMGQEKGWNIDGCRSIRLII